METQKEIEHKGFLHKAKNKILMSTALIVAGIGSVSATDWLNATTMGQITTLIGYLFDFVDVIIARLPNVMFGLFVVAMIMLFLKFGKGIIATILRLVNSFVK